MSSYIDLLYYDMNNTWNLYTKYESIIHILHTYDHPLVSILIERMNSLKDSKLQEWYFLYHRIDIIKSRPYHYMKYMFLTHEINDIWS